MNETSSNKLLNAVDFSDLNGLDATTLLTMNSTIGSPVQDKPLLMSSPPKDITNDDKLMKKRKLDDEDKSSFLKDKNSRKRQLQSTYQKFDENTEDNLLDSDFLYGSDVDINKINKDSLLTTVSQNIFNACEETNVNITNREFYYMNNDEAYENLAFSNEYKDDILKNLYALEDSYKPIMNPCLVDREVSRIFIKPSMRAILIDWLLQVSKSFRLSKASFFLTMSILDRYLSCNRVSLKKLQLLAITAIFMAAKCEEVKLPKLSKYCEMTDKSYTTDEMLSAEMAILQSLEFKMSPPSPEIFLFEYLNIFRKEMNINLKRKSPIKNQMDGDELYRYTRLLLQTSYEEDMIENFGYLLFQYILTSPQFIHLKTSYQCSLAAYMIRLMYHQDMQHSMNDVVEKYIKENIDSESCVLDKLTTYETKIEQIWPNNMIAITNGIVADEDFQEHIRVLIMEIADPSTNLPSIANQENYHYCAVLKNYCNLLNN
ncbi:uncharacterized protein HGUI_04040 [Hanseniaspora guilliermondii]|uniref:Cyclin-like domain-containing protein n=1 Tax=Hanseniaspora guilliermondii TaxID=56406 RepID=A0A1L0D3U1_9ASCO|nr:uncharacterized protein HGUI_04040 [Hanseniaspora guilliermondii]